MRNQYFWYRFQYQYVSNFNGLCVTCPNGATCTKPNMTVQNLNTQPTYWRFTKNDNNFHKCLNAKSCIGTSNNSVSLHGPDAQCKEGHTSTLCDVCKDGYKKMNGVCTRCETTGDELMLVPWATLYVCMLLIFLYYMRQVGKGKGENIEEEGSLVMEQSSYIEEIIGTIRIMISFFQVFTSFEITMSIPWPMQFSQVTSANDSQPICISQNC